MKEPWSPSPRALRGLLIATVVASTSVRLVLGRHCLGFHTGDDVEILMTGFRSALGVAYQPWPIRNLLVPELVVAPLLRLAARLGIHATAVLVWIATWPFVAAASVNIVLVHRLGRRWLANERAAVLAAVLSAGHWLPLGYGSTVYPRTLSTTCVLAAVLLVTASQASRLRIGWAGAVIGLAFAVRYSEVVLLAPLAVLVAWDAWRRGREVVVLRLVALGAGFLAASIVTVGLMDLATWGRPAASLVEFARYTLVERCSSSLVPNQPWYWYAWRLPKWLPLTLWPFLVAADRKRDLRPGLFVLLPILALSLIHHKELRYLQPVMPFVMLVAAAGAHAWWRRGRRRTTATLVVMSMLLGVSGLSFRGRASLSAVTAARALADHGIRRVALSQSWAYGLTLFLAPGSQVLDLPVRPGPEELRTAAGRCEAIALYEDVVGDRPELVEVLRQAGYSRGARFAIGNSRPVVVFAQRGVIPDSRATRVAEPAGSATMVPSHGHATASVRPRLPANFIREGVAHEQRRSQVSCGFRSCRIPGRAGDRERFGRVRCGRRTRPPHRVPQPHPDVRERALSALPSHR